MPPLPPLDSPEAAVDRPDAADPVRIRIPSVDVDAAVRPLRLDAEGVLGVPTNFDETGWHEAGPEPGEPGRAVVVGHVDDRDGPAVFHRLTELTDGATVLIDRADGSTVAFRVRSVGSSPKDAFPTDAVYGATDVPELRLITCGGPFDADAGRYLDNDIVYADFA